MTFKTQNLVLTLLLLMQTCLVVAQEQRPAIIPLAQSSGSSSAASASSSASIGGLSDGGFCAANLALRHPGEYGAVVSMDGFYSAYSDLAVMNKVFGAGSPAITENNPSTLVTAAEWSLPRFWLITPLLTSPAHPWQLFPWKAAA